MKVTETDDAFDFQDAYQRERREDARAARVFERVCRESAVNDLLPAVELLDLTIDGWRSAGAAGLPELIVQSVLCASLPGTEFSMRDAALARYMGLTAISEPTL